MTRRAPVNRADLLRTLVRGPFADLTDPEIPRNAQELQRLERLAGLFGFGLDMPRSDMRNEARSKMPTVAPTTAEVAPLVLPARPLLPVPFHVAERFENRTRGKAEDETDPPSTAPYRGWRGAPDAPSWIPLARWHQIEPVLKMLLRPVSPSRRVDVEKLVRRAVRARTITELPFEERIGWVQRLTIIVDRSTRLTPIWQDQEEVVAQICSLLRGADIEVLIWDEALGECRCATGARTEIRQLEARGGVFLVLGDLGQFADDPAVMEYWYRLGRELGMARAAALVPQHPASLPAPLAVDWRLGVWDHTAPARRGSRANDRDLVRRLLALISPTVRIQPALMRAVRVAALPEASASTEIRAWSSPDMAQRDSAAGALDLDRLQELRRTFVGLAKPARERSLEAIREWRAEDHPAVWFEELLSLDEDSQALLPEGDLEDARSYVHMLLGDLPDEADRDRGTSLEAYVRRIADRVPEEVLDAGNTRFLPELTELIWRTRKDDPDYRRIGPGGGADPRWTLSPITCCLRGSQLALSSGAHSGSALVQLPTRDGIVQIAPIDPFKSIWGDEGPPDWVDAAGSDPFGCWISVKVGKVRLCLRWIPPGSFRMGSPEDEPGRFDQESPQVDVTFQSGFWLMDAPVTQALWEEVMGSNPSEFVDPERPVEQVSFTDADAFLDRINGLVPGLDLRLPSEAEWEYACRAGTETAIWTGPLEIRGKNNAPALDAIAWYRGNSGVGFDLEGGWDASGWEETQYDFERAGTRKVRLKEANPWGCHDMLGNVFEWCADARSDSHEGADPEGGARQASQQATDVGRVVRGGSWHGEARHVRAAYRFWAAPEYRIDDLGFRCARGQASTGRLAPEAPGAGGPQVRAEDPRARSGPVSTVRLTPERRNVHVSVPDAPYVIRTDLAEVEIGTLARHHVPWARRLARDRFGLRAEAGIGKADICLRWIPPGRFLMGSPEDEPGRVDWEGPQVDVTFRSGFWLMDSPVTQALWEEVMGSNPSQFVDPERPVEQVSFEDAEAFLGEINGRVPGLDLRLPSEAEWEYACRASTETAIWTGPLEILGKNNAPALDAIAWYGGNSGVDFDLENGADVSFLEETQHDFERAATRKVRQKEANPWGCHDMLGNVLEWCADAWLDSHKGADPDGAPRQASQQEKDSGRVIRGGSWLVEARGVRAAYRYWDVPEYRRDDLGFRCARGQASSGRLAPEAHGAGGPQVRAEDPRALRGPSDASDLEV